MKNFLDLQHHELAKIYYASQTIADQLEGRSKSSPRMFSKNASEEAVQEIVKYIADELRRAFFVEPTIMNWEVDGRKFVLEVPPGYLPGDEDGRGDLPGMYFTYCCGTYENERPLRIVNNDGKIEFYIDNMKIKATEKSE